MFSKPNSGWVDIKIGNYNINASYLTDVPVDFLNSLISSLENNLPISVLLDEEGIEDLIVVFYGNSYILVEDNEKYIETKIEKVDFDEFRRQIIEGIEKYFNDWVNWNLGDDSSTLQKREKILREKINVAKKLLSEKTIK